MKYLITGGCGFIGSHLAEELLIRGHEVTAVDNISTGSWSNISSIDEHPHARFVIGDAADKELMNGLIENTDRVFHLAASVGVKLIMEHPVRTIDNILNTTSTILKLCNRWRKPVLLASTSEVYGKADHVPFKEDGDRVQGPTTRHRWAYAGAKAMDEFLALAYYKETELPIVVARLFNTVGPRQSGTYGMVVPRFIRCARLGDPIEIYGTGEQTRTFCHVDDAVGALIALLDCVQARGQIFNVGSTEEVSIKELAAAVYRCVGTSNSSIRFVSYEEAYGAGFEDLLRRVPDTIKIKEMIGWKAAIGLKQILQDVWDYQKSSE